MQLLARRQLWCCQQQLTLLHVPHLPLLAKKQDVHPLYTQLQGKGISASADRATAQQLQALHTENLQLKSLLKQEIDARQQLESQHAALLGLLRYVCCAAYYH
jgi:hypothetical protein